IVHTQFDRFDLPTFEKFKQTGVYQQHYWTLGERLQYSSPKRNLAFGIGHRFEWMNYNPTISGELAFKGRSQFNTLYTNFNLHTLDRNIFPNRGMKIEVEAGHIQKQNLRIHFYLDDQLIPNTDS